AESLVEPTDDDQGWGDGGCQTVDCCSDRSPEALAAQVQQTDEAGDELQDGAGDDEDLLPDVFTPEAEEDEQRDEGSEEHLNRLSAFRREPLDELVHDAFSFPSMGRSSVGCCG